MDEMTEKQEEATRILEAIGNMNLKMEDRNEKQKLDQKPGRIIEFINRNEALLLNAEETTGNILDTISTLMGNEIVESNTPTFTQVSLKIECSLDGLYVIQGRLENIYSRLKQIDLLLKLL